MVDTTKLSFECDRFFFNTLVDSFEHLHKFIKFSFQPKLYLNIRQLPFAHTQQRLLRPLAKPINGGAINQTREHSQPGGKSITNRTKT